MKTRFLRAFFTLCSLRVHPARALKAHFHSRGEPQDPDDFVVFVSQR
jgi:hypothetical protein